MLELETSSFTDHVFVASPDPLAADAPRGRLMASTLLMENVATGRILEGGGSADVAAVQDALGRPILLSLSSDHHLYAVVCPTTDGSDRREYDLTGGFGADAQVVAFGAGQSDAGDISLAIAVARAGKVELHVSRPLPSRIGATPWHDFHALWLPRGERGGDVAVTRVLVGNEPLRRGSAPLVIAVTREGGEANYYQADSDLTAPPSPWKRFPLPENAGKVIDLVVGRNRNGDGVYALFERSGRRQLYFVPHNRQAPSRELPLPPGVARQGALGVLPTKPHGLTDLFLVGDGVFLLPVASQRTGADLDEVITLVKPEVAGSLRNILVCDDDQSISVWAIDGGGDLLYLQGTRTGPRLMAAAPVPCSEELELAGEAALDAAEAAAGVKVEWGAAVPGFRAGIRLIAPLRNRLQRANSLITLGRGSELQQFLETPGDGLWDAKPVAVQDQTRTEAFHCYATNLTLTNEQGEPFEKPPLLSLTAAERVEVTINGVRHELGADPVEVRPDTQGNVMIMNRVSTLASPMIYIESPVTGRCVVDPARKVRSAMSELDSADKLAAARLPDGSPVVTGLSDDEVKATAKALGNLQALGNSLPADGSRASSLIASTLAVATDADGVWFSLRGGSDGMSDGGGAVSYVDHGALFAAGGVAPAGLDWLRSALRAAGGAVIQAMSTAVSMVRGAWEAVVQKVGEAWDFAINLGNRAYRFAVATLAQVDQLVDWLVRHVIKIPLEKAAAWLGFMTSWEDVVVTHNVMLNLAEQVMRKAEGEIDGLAGRIDQFFGNLIVEARRLKPISDPRAGTGVQHHLDASRDTLVDGVTPDVRRRQKKAADFQQCPAGAFATYHLANSVRASAATVPPPASGAVQELMTTLTSLWKQIGGPVTAFLNESYAALGDGALSLNALIGRLADLVPLLETIRAAAVSIARHVGGFAAQIRTLLTGEIDIPFLSWLYRRHVGRPMTLLGGFMLLLSVPVTGLHKVFHGEAPFPLEDVAPGQAGEAGIAAKKPRTYGLDTLIGVPFWTVLGAGGAVVTGALYGIFKVLMSFTVIADKAYAIIRPLKQVLGPLVSPAMLIFKVVMFIGAGIWAGVSVLWPDPVANVIRFGRWGISTFALIGELIGAFDPTDAFAAILRLVVALLDALLATIWTLVRMARHATRELLWLWVVDLTEALTCTIGHLSTLCSCASSLVPELTAKGAFTTASYVFTAVRVPFQLTTLLSAPYIPMSQFVDPIA